MILFMAGYTRLASGLLNAVALPQTAIALWLVVWVWLYAAVCTFPTATSVRVAACAGGGGLGFLCLRRSTG